MFIQLERASILLRNLFFLSLAALLTAYANHGRGFGSLPEGFTMGPGVPEELTCENTSFQ